MEVTAHADRTSEPAIRGTTRLDRHGERLAGTLGIPEGEHLVVRARFWKRHGNRVGALARRVAAELDLDPAIQRQVLLAGKYHDVGKLLDPRVTELCHSPRPLTAGEAGEVSLHSYYGAVFVRTRATALGLDAEDASVVAVMIGGHHWRYIDFDRSKQALFAQPEFSGDEHREYRALPAHAFLGARILKAVDTYQTMCEIRDYQLTAKTPRAALRELLECRGTEFDPVVVDALLAVLSRRRHRGRFSGSRAGTGRHVQSPASLRQPFRRFFVFP